MNRQSAILSFIGHVMMFAIILLWGMKWPFQPKEIEIEKVEVIDTATFNSLVAQSQPAQTPADETTVEPEVIPNDTGAVDGGDDEFAPVEIIREYTPPVVEPIAPAPPAAPAAPAFPPIGEAAPRAALRPVARPAGHSENAAAVARAETQAEPIVPVERVPETAVNPDDVAAVASAIAAELGAGATATAPDERPTTQVENTNVETVAPDTQASQSVTDPETATTPNISPIERPAARVASQLNEVNLPSDNVVAEPTPEPSVDDLVDQVVTETAPVAPLEAPAEPKAPASPAIAPIARPAARVASQLNVVESPQVVATPEPAPVEPTVDDLVEQVVTETEAPAPTPEPEPEAAPEAPPIGQAAPRSAQRPAPRPADLRSAVEAPVDNVAIETQLASVVDAQGTQPSESRDLSRIETGLIVQKIAQNWNLTPIIDKPNYAQLAVTIGFSTDNSGQLSSDIRLLDPADPSADHRAAFQTAEAAVRNSLPLDMPTGVDKDGVNWTLTFDPSAQNVGVV